LPVPTPTLHESNLPEREGLSRVDSVANAISTESEIRAEDSQFCAQVAPKSQKVSLLGFASLITALASDTFRGGAPVNPSTVSASLAKSAVTQASLKVVELLGAERPDLELLIWATVSATDEEVNELVSLVSPQDAELLERVVKSVFWSFGLCDWAGGLPS
jgi:hypothetical protein